MNTIVNFYWDIVSRRSNLVSMHVFSTLLAFSKLLEIPIPYLVCPFFEQPHITQSTGTTTRPTTHKRSVLGTSIFGVARPFLDMWVAEVWLFKGSYLYQVVSPCSTVWMKGNEVALIFGQATSCKWNRMYKTICFPHGLDGTSASNVLLYVANPISLGLVSNIFHPTA